MRNLCIYGAKQPALSTPELDVDWCCGCAEAEVQSVLHRAQHRSSAGTSVQQHSGTVIQCHTFLDDTEDFCCHNNCTW